MRVQVLSKQFGSRATVEPMFAEITAEQQERVVQTIAKSLRGAARRAA